MQNLKARFRDNSLIRVFFVLQSRARKRVLWILLIQVLLGFLDLLGVLAIGILGTLSISGLQSKAPSGQIERILNLTGLSSLGFETQVYVLAIGSILLLVGKTLLSIVFTKRLVYFLSSQGAQLSTDLIAKSLSRSILMVQERTIHETLYAVTRGVESLILQVIATSVVLVSDLSLLLIMFTAILLVDPLTALVALLIFLIASLALQKGMLSRSQTLAKEAASKNISSNEKIVEVFSSYRESLVRGRRNYYAREISKIRISIAETVAELSFMPFVSKYVIEATLILGGVLIGGIQFILTDAAGAIGRITIFIVAGSRIAPALLRAQQGMIQIKQGLGLSQPTLELIDQLSETPLPDKTDDRVQIDHSGFTPTVSLTNLRFRYPEGKTDALKDINLSIQAGKSIAIVGPSGAGKTTLVDVLLGVITPDEGVVEISGLQPELCITKWPGAIAYVPQDVLIINGTISENVGIGYPKDAIPKNLVLEALEIAQMGGFVNDLPLGIDTPVGERGTKLSGGQRQRLGIARAIFTRPQLLVLDEATSSLDGETEANISEALHKLKGRTTLILIAHRLSTVMHSDIVVYMDKGEVLHIGSFSEVRKAIPNFDKQAKLMGL
jgi:ABC-type multidrug transport system fused ATPase/permease subunit